MQPRILLAIGDPEQMRMVKSYLAKTGFQVVADVKDGPTALRMVRNITCNLVILDSDLPGASGLEVARIIEADKIAPILLLVSNWENDLLAEDRDSGIYSVLVKPVTETALAAGIDMTLRNYRKYQKLEAEVEKLKETLETRKLLERAKGILMETMGISEDQAFRRLQRQSMNKSKPLKEVAEAIILAHELTR